MTPVTESIPGTFFETAPVFFLFAHFLFPYEEVQSFAEVFKAARISGGSLQTVIRGTAAQMAEIMDTRREIRTILFPIK